MSIINSFKHKKEEEKHHEDFKIQYNSFGQPQVDYDPNLVTQNFSNKIRFSSKMSSNDNNGQDKGSIGSLAETSVWSNEDENQNIKLNVSNKTYTKPNFMSKKSSSSQQPTLSQQQSMNQNVQNSQQGFSDQKQNNNNKKLELQKTTSNKSKFEIKDEFDYLDYSEMNFPEIEFQKKIVNEIVAPGGLRCQQQKDVLNTFAKDCQSLSPCVIGSLLINKLLSDEQDIVKKRSIYAIEILVKKHQNYNDFFKKQQFMIQKSQQINLDNSKFISLSNQLLSVIHDPSLEISETSEVSFDFSHSNDLSKYGKKAEPNQNMITGKQTAKQTSCVNLIEDLLDQPIHIQRPPLIQQNIKQNPPQDFSNNIIKNTGQQNLNPNSKQKLFEKFKTKPNLQTQNMIQQEHDLLSMIDDMKIQQINQDLLDQITSQNESNSHISQIIYPSLQANQYDSSHISSVAGVQKDISQQNNNTIQKPKMFTTINMNFGEVEQSNLEQQYFNQSHFNIDDNTPTKSSLKQQNYGAINEDAFDFIRI